MPDRTDPPRAPTPFPDAEDHFRDERFVDRDAADLDLSHRDFDACAFERVRLAGATLAGTTFEGCVFEHCDLTMARVAGAAFREVVFRHCKLMGIDWTEVRGMIFTPRFESCILDHSTFADRKMQETVFHDCKAREATFAGLDLSRASFAGTDLEGARFLDNLLVETDLSRATGYHIQPDQNRLDRTRFSIEAALELVGELGVIVPDR